jgi:hypothetical protein
MLAWAAEGTPSGGSGSVKVKGESDSYRIATPKASVSLQAKGSGDLTLKIRAVLPAGAIPSDGAKVRILDNGNELGHLTLSIYASGNFADRTDVVPSGSSSRNYHLNDGSHTITVEAKGGNAAVALHWKGKHPRSRGHVVAAEPVETAPSEISAAPLAEAAPVPAPAPVPPPPASPPAAVPEPTIPPVGVAATPAPPPAVSGAPLVLPKPVPFEQLTPQTPLAAITETPTVTQVSEAGRSPLPFIFLGVAAACAVGSGVTLGLATGQYSSYNSTPETQGGTATNRAGMLNTANTEVAAAEVLGAAAAAFLVATGVSLLF